MKCIFFLAFSLIVFFHGLGQSPFNAAYRVDSLTQKATVFSDIYATDTAFYVFGLTVKNGINVGFFSKIALDGEVVFHKIIGNLGQEYLTWYNTFSLTSMQKTKDNHIILVGTHKNNQPFVLKMNDKGEVIHNWLINLPDTSQKAFFTKIIELEHGKYCLFGSKIENYVPKSASGCFVLIDSLGNILYEKSYENPNWNISGTDIIKSNDHYYILFNKHKGGMQLGDPPFQMTGIVAYADSSGNIISVAETPTNEIIGFNHLRLSVSQKICIAGSKYTFQNNTYYPFGYITVIDSALNLFIWHKLFNGTIRYIGIGFDENILIPNNKSIIYNGQEKGVTSIYKLDAETGDSISEVFFINSTVNSIGAQPYINKIQQLPDGSIVACGEIMDGYFASPTAGYWGWLLRTDANGNAPGQVSSLPPPRQADSFLSLHPNPAQTHITFSCTLPHAEIHIFDLAGREIALLPAGERTVWDTGRQAAGMYFYSLTQAGRVLQTGKFSVQK